MGARSGVSEEISFLLFPSLKKLSSYYRLVPHFIADKVLPILSRFNPQRSPRILIGGLFSFFYRLKKLRVGKEG